MKRLKNLAGAGIVGLASLVGGCETTGEEDAALLGIALLGASPYASTPQESSSMQLGGDAILRDQMSRRDKVQVTVNMNSRKPERKQSDKNIFVICNYTKDFNNSGTISYPDEYVGIKRKFTTKEPIDISAIIRGNGGKLDFEMWDNNRNIIIQTNYSVSRGKRCGGRLKPGAMKPGNYVICWKMNGEVEAVLPLEIVE